SSSRTEDGLGSAPNGSRETPERGIRELVRVRSGSVSGGFPTAEVRKLPNEVSENSSGTSFGAPSERNRESRNEVSENSFDETRPRQTRPREMVPDAALAWLLEPSLSSDRAPAAQLKDRAHPRLVHRALSLLAGRRKRSRFLT